MTSIAVAAEQPRTVQAGVPQAADVAGIWDLDPGRSSLEFRVKHFWRLVTVRGRFATFQGQVAVDRSGLVSGGIVVNAASFDTGRPMRDRHLRSADFFDVTNHPQLAFSISRVTHRSDDRLSVTGDLTIAGRRTPIKFEARYTDVTDTQVVIEARVPVDRRDYGMTWNPLGISSHTALLVVRAHFKRVSRRLAPPGAAA